MLDSIRDPYYNNDLQDAFVPQASHFNNFDDHVDLYAFNRLPSNNFGTPERGNDEFITNNHFANLQPADHTSGSQQCTSIFSSNDHQINENLVAAHEQPFFQEQIPDMDPDTQAAIEHVYHAIVPNISSLDSPYDAYSTSESDRSVHLQLNTGKKFCFDSEEEFISQESEETQKKKSNPQNHRRNCPGLIFNKVRVNCIARIEEDCKLSQEDFDRLRYIEIIIRASIQNEKQGQDFLAFLKALQSKRKTWKNIEDNLKGHALFGSILLKCIDGFLSSEGQEDFDDWLTHGRLKTSEDVIKNDKGWFRDQFRAKFGRMFPRV
jgi:hypothetical protein